jgi:hypothetical protein
MHFALRRATNTGLIARAFSVMAHPAAPPSSGVSRFRRHAPVPGILLAIICSLPLGGCSFDLGSLGPDKEKPQQQAEPKPTDDISARSVSDAQGYATHGQVLAKSGNNEEALAEFERALALDPYNVRALYGRGLIRQAEKEHQQAIEDFTAHSTRPRKRSPISTKRYRQIRTARKPGQLVAPPMSVWVTRSTRPLPIAAHWRYARETKPREAASRAPAASS